MAESLSPGDGQDVLARFKRAREKRDTDLMLELFSEEAEYRSDPFEPAMTGQNAIRAHWNEVADQQVHVEFDAERTWVVGRTVLSNWHSAHTLRRSAERVRTRGFSTMEMDQEGRIERLREWAISRIVGADSTFAPDRPGESTAGEQHG